MGMGATLVLHPEGWLPELWNTHLEPLSYLWHDFRRPKKGNRYLLGELVKVDSCNEYAHVKKNQNKTA